MVKTEKELDKLGDQRSTPKAAVLLGKQNDEAARERYETWQRVNEWNLWEHLDTPGKMSDEYMLRRLRDREFILKADKERKEVLNTGKKRFPTPHDIINREMSRLPVLVIRNTMKYPKGYDLIIDKLAKWEAAQKVTLYLDLPDAGTGKTIIRPNACVAFPLSVERYINRDVEDGRIEQFDHENKEHNADIRRVGKFRSGQNEQEG